MTSPRLIALALASGLAFSHAAQAQVTLHGAADMYAGSMQFAGDQQRRNTVQSGGMSTAWMGVTGTEDLGNGLKAHFALESFLRMNTGASGRFDGDTMYARNAHVALSGHFGRLTMGRAVSPSFLPTILFNPFGDSFVFSPLVLHTYVDLYNGTNWTGSHFADSGWSSQVQYATPTVGGFNANVHYQFGNGDAPSGARNVGGNVNYNNGPLALTAHYEHARLSNPHNTHYTDGAKRTAWMLGGAYDLKAVKLYGTYGQTKVHDSSNFTRKTGSVGATIPVGAGNVMLAYAQTKENALNRTRKTASAGYMHSLSKRTQLYGNVMHDKITHAKSGTSYGVGILHKF